MSKHECKEKGYGPTIIELNGRWTIRDGLVFLDAIKFCPWCGKKLGK